MANAISSNRGGGLSQGHDDAEEWIQDTLRDLHDVDDLDAELADELRGADKDGHDEALINAVTDSQLAKLVGHDLRDAEGDWTPEAREWLEGYNEGWREAVAKRLAEIEAL